ncbi:hypothetical protein JQ620_15325 [Bradyrhizobium sp. AUGA SZCCT0274]|uniref:hypothetical protein n=1 Tax=Bradyrhizobium sp. AUGA SZCCT0274 TaxID=2807670 RepID=UPI001BA540E3|nr:hypothetical protein [Bradyrhizobium sp. AUGA SZCCT0274]MBR1241500.1 hypothetical protein [Bradyrhizobium sp. AUGA SZCCT0274]
MSKSLPPRVQSKVMALRDTEQQALTQTNMTQRAISELQRVQGNNPTGDKAQSAARELARLQGLQPDYQARYKALANLNARVAHYLSLLPANVDLADAKVRVKLKDGETHIKAVQRLRGEIIALISEQSRVQRSVPTNKEAKAAAAEYVQSLSRRIDPKLVIEHDKFSVLYGRGVVGERDPSPSEILAWIDPKLVLTRLEAMIDARDKSANQMSASDRTSRLAEMKTELLDLERKEQAHIDAAKEEGTTIEQRINVDPRALLGLLIVGEQSKAA